jgi:hypothetical protein
VDNKRHEDISQLKASDARADEFPEREIVTSLTEGRSEQNDILCLRNPVLSSYMIPYNFYVTSPHSHMFT